MFAFYYRPYGSTTVEGICVPGYLEKFPPARLSWNAFRQNKGVLIEAAYTPDRLKLLFPDSTFPQICFMYSDLRDLSWEQMCGLCKGFGITTSRNNFERRRTLRAFMKEYC
jgi:hypothetical protein